MVDYDPLSAMANYAKEHEGIDPEYEQFANQLGMSIDKLIGMFAREEKHKA